MGWPKGLTWAEVHRRRAEKDMARPLEFTDEVIEQMADRLIEWAKKDTATEIAKFCIEEEILTEVVSRLALKNDKFSQALRFAHMSVAARLRDRVNKGEYHYGIYNRLITMYDKPLHMHERENLEHELELRAKTGQLNPQTPTVVIQDYSKAQNPQTTHSTQKTHKPKKPKKPSSPK